MTNQPHEDGDHILPETWQEWERENEQTFPADPTPEQADLLFQDGSDSLENLLRDIKGIIFEMRTNRIAKDKSLGIEPVEPRFDNDEVPEEIIETIARDRVASSKNNRNDSKQKKGVEHLSATDAELKHEAMISAYRRITDYVLHDADPTEFHGRIFDYRRHGLISIDMPSANDIMMHFA